MRLAYDGYLFRPLLEDTMMRAAVGIVAIAALLGTGPAAADGKDIYARACAVCHNTLPPKIGEKAAWEPRAKLGLEALVASVIKGKGAMPPKAGNPVLSEADLRAATEYLLALSR
jgi:cytochrome c5